MTYCVADAQIVPPVVVQQNGEQIVRQHFMDNLGHVGQQLVQVQGERSRGRNFEQEIQQLASLFKTDTGFACSLHGLFLSRDAQAAVASTIFTLALAPIRVAPAAVIAWTSCSVRIPPEAFTPMLGPTAARISAMSCAVAPDVEKPVEVLT